MESQTQVRAFHPRTMGVIWSGQVVKTAPLNKAVLIDFAPVTFRGKSKFWVAESHIVSQIEKEI